MTETPPLENRISPWRRIGQSPALDVFLFVVLTLLVVVFFARGTSKLGYTWHWYRIPRYVYTWGDAGFEPGPLLHGLWITLKISGVSLAASMVIGLVTALFRLSGSFLARTLARWYLEAIRNTPLLIQLFFVYFVVGPVVGLDRMPSAILALSLFEGAYASEIFRSGIVSIHRGQWEASGALGMNLYQTYRYIILPQALRRVLPPLTSQAVSLVKDSALVSTIAIYDLTMRAQAIIAETYLTFELWFTVAALYLVVTLSLSLLVSYLETRFKIAS